MKNNNSTSFIIFSGILVLCIFTVVATLNILPKNKESDSYYVKVNEDMSAKVESLNIENGKLVITTSGDTEEYCVKSTRSMPENNNLCWKKVENNTATISIYQNKKYYVWIKDTKGNISFPMSLNTKDKE